MRGQGYAPEDVEHILAIEMRDDVVEDRKESITILTNAFQEGLLPESDYRAALDAQGYTDNEINLRVQLIRFKQESDIRRLSVAQLKNAWESNVLGEPEVRVQLADLGYATSETNVLIDTWKAEIAPKFLAINQATILSMYRYAVINRADTRSKLKVGGYDASAADALITLEEAKNPEAFGAAPARRQRFLSLSAVVDLYAIGRITDQDVTSWAEVQGFKGADVENMAFLIKAQAKEANRPLAQSTVEDAYITGIFDRVRAQETLVSLGFTIEDADIILQTVERTNPAIFSPETVTATRQPSISALVQAVVNGFLTEAEFYEKAASIGFTKEGAAVYLANGTKSTSKGTKSLTKAEVLEAYRKNLASAGTTHTKLEGMGYSYEDAELLIEMEQKGIEATDIFRAFKAGYLEAEDAYFALAGLGYSDDEISVAILSVLEPGSEEE